MDRVGRILKRGAAVIHAELAIGGRIPHVAVVAEDGVFDAHQVEDALDFAQVADRVAVEAANEVDLAVRLALKFWRSAGLAAPEVLENSLHDVVVAGDVAAYEGWRMGEGNVKLARDRALFLRRLDEGVEVVADDFRHAGGRNRDHLGLVHVVAVGKPVDHVVEAAEHCRILGHRGGDARGRLLEVAREVAAVIGDAALTAMDEGQRALETHRREHGAERLAGFSRVYDQRFAGEVLLLIFRRLRPFANAL